MSLTLTQAGQAGALAVEAANLQAAITTLQGAISVTAAIVSISVNTGVGSLEASVPLSVADSATLMNTTLVIYQNMLSAITTNLQNNF